MEDKMESAPRPTSNDRACEGLRALDVSQGVAGPYCAQILRQFGAEVIKLEPFEGDWSRSIGIAHDGMSPLAMAYDHAKSSVAWSVLQCSASTPAKYCQRSGYKTTRIAELERAGAIISES